MGAARMTALSVIAALAFVAVVAGASLLGLCAHLCWLLVADPRALLSLVAMFVEVVKP